MSPLLITDIRVESAGGTVCVDHVTHSRSNPVLQTVLIASQSLTTDQRDVIFTQLADNSQLFDVPRYQT